jgi:UDP-N-acetylmuramyl tripeptide synthase
MPLYLTFLLAKLASIVIRRLGRGGGTALPGLIAERLNPKVLTYLSRQLKGTILIVGTNGKTTTARLTASILEASGAMVIHNRTGSNLVRGVISTLVQQASWKGTVSGDWGLFEIDEAVFPKIVGLLKPRFILATNLFRDQLDRYGEVDSIAAKWREACATLTPATTLILNADDPAIASLALNSPAQPVFFGLTTDGPKDVAAYADTRRCPVCGQALIFTSVAYSHLGHYACSQGDFRRPTPVVWADHLIIDGMRGSKVTLHTPEEETEVSSQLAGTYNVYNIIAAVTLATALRLPKDVILRKVSSFQGAFGRLEHVQLGSTRLTLILVKNPTGFNQVIEMLRGEKEAAAFWFLLNDHFADGRDVSWIWDVELEALMPQSRTIIAGGTRAADMGVRLKYAGASSGQMRVSSSLADGLRAISAMKAQNVYALCTYTAMLELRKQLQRQKAVQAFHAD